MTDLVRAIHDAMRDRRVRPDELSQLVSVAAEGGVQADEVRRIVRALQQSEDGFTPVARARLWVELSRLDGTRPALEALAQARVRTEGFHQLSESEAILGLLLAEVAEAHGRLQGSVDALRALSTAESPDADGRWTPAAEADPGAHAAALTELHAAQRRLIAVAGRARGFLDGLSAGERALVTAAQSSDWSARWRLEQLRTPLPPAALAGLSTADVEATRVGLPELAPSPSSDAERLEALGVTFATPTEWAWEASRGLTLPTGTLVSALPTRGALALFAEGATSLPGNLVVEGAFRAVDGEVRVGRGARGTIDGVPFVARADDAAVKLAGGVLVGSAGLEIPLSLMPRPTPPAADAEPTGTALPEERVIRFILGDTRLPDGTALRQGQGEMTVVFQEGVAIGVLEGSIRLKPGAVLARTADGAEPVTLRALGETAGELRRGTAFVKDDVLVGLGGYSEAMIDGITVETDYSNDEVSVSAKRPATYLFGRGARVTGLPERSVTIGGEQVTLAVGGQQVTIHSGTVRVEQGRVVEIGPGSEVTIAGLRLTTAREKLAVLEAAPARWPRGAAIHLDRNGFELRGRDVRVSAAGGILGEAMGGVDGDDDDPATEPNPAVHVRDGQVKVRLVEEPMLPRHVAVEITAGDVGVTSGRWTYKPGPRQTVREGPEELPGPIVRIHEAGKSYEIDTRRMWPTADGTTLGGRFRELTAQAGGVFSDPRLATELEAVRGGRRTLRAGSSGELVKTSQQVLGHFLGTALNASGQLDASTVSALQRFQRLNRLPPTGTIDAATLGRLIAVAPPAEQLARPKRKVMVMVALNGDVPDELTRFRALARERGAEAVVLGHPEAAPGTSSADLERYFQMAERGEIDFDWLVISGHSGGTSTWGSYGRLDYSDLERWAKEYPTAGAQIEKLSLLNCYNVTIERANSYWPELFPNVVGLAGFMYSAPGKKAQSSDENLLHAGRLLAGIPKGELPDQATAERLGRTYANDNYIKWQNASMWVRYRKPDGSDGSHFAMTSSAAYEMRRHGAGDELEVAAFRQGQEFERYLTAEDPAYAEPPAEHHSGPLREYLNAVDGVMGRCESRLRTAEGYHRRAERDPSVTIPEEYAYLPGLQRQVDEMRRLRGQILFLIYFADVRKFFDEKYGPAIDALHRLFDEHGIGERFPRGDELRRMNRQQVLARLRSLEEALERLPSDVRHRAVEADAWRIMIGTDPAETTLASPDALVRRARAFLGELDPQFIAAEWL